MPGKEHDWDNNGLFRTDFVILLCELHCHLHLSAAVEREEETFHYLLVADNHATRTVLSMRLCSFH